MTTYTPPEPPPGWVIATEEPREPVTPYGRLAVLGIAEMLRRVAGVVGLEGAFLGAAAILGAVGASYVHPAGPWLVVAGIALTVGVLLVRAARVEP